MKNFILSLIIIFCLNVDGYSQCAMCRKAAETNLESKENKVGAGLNRGILYLMSVPYLLLIGGATAWYINRKKG